MSKLLSNAIIVIFCFVFVVYLYGNYSISITPNKTMFVTNNSVQIVSQYTTKNLYESGGVVVGADNEYIVIVNNRYAKDPTYDEVTAFIESDKTDEIPYNVHKFVCADYAEKVHNNAEYQNIKAGIVSIEFDDGVGHMFNVFNTTDRGEVFVDCTGYDSYIRFFDIGTDIKYFDNSELDGTIKNIWYHW